MIFKKPPHSLNLQFCHSIPNSSTLFSPSPRTFSMAASSSAQSTTNPQVDFAYMLDLDSLGFNVKAGYGGNTFKLRIAFPRRAEDRMDVKTLVVEMLQAAKPQSD